MAAVLAAAGLYLFQETVLQGVGGLLVYNEPATAASAVWILDADHGIDEAARLYHAGSVTQILFVGGRERRLDRWHIWPEDAHLRQFRDLHVPDSAFVGIPGDAVDDWDSAGELRDWLQQQPPDVNVVVLCDVFGSRRQRKIFDVVLPPAIARRVKVRAFDHRDHRPADWWKTQSGIVAFINSSVSLAHVYWFGQAAEKWHERDLEQYAASFE